MRDLSSYDVIYCDIDDTLIHGFWTELMKVTWKYFRSNTFSDMLMTIQGIFGIYELNHKLYHMLVRADKPVVFLTARKACRGTEMLLNKIFENRLIYGIVALQTDFPSEAKINYITVSIADEDLKCCIFDDNKDVRLNAAAHDIDAFEPTSMFEELVK